MRKVLKVAALAGLAAGLVGCSGDLEMRAIGATLSANQAILDPYTLRGIDDAETAGDVDGLNAGLARDLVDANRRLAEEMKGGQE